MRLVPLLLSVVVACSSQDPDPGQPDAAADAPDAAPGQPDAGGDVGAVDCQFDSGVQWDVLVEVVQLGSADDSKCVVIERRNDCPPDWICKAVPFTVLEARIGHDGQVRTQTEASAMTWQATHHNWADTADIDIDGVRYHLALIFGETSHYELTATDIDSSATLWGPVQLDPVNPR